MKNYGGFNSQRNVTVGFKLSLCMAGRHSSGTKHCHDQKLIQKMAELSKSMLKEGLKASEQEAMSFSTMPLETVSQIISLLGEHRDYENLEVRYLFTRRGHSANDYPKTAYPKQPVESPEALLLGL
jgi:hypothetical protein